MNLAAAILERGTVRLEPFEPHHCAGLAAVAEADPELFRHIPFPVAKQGYAPWFEYLRADQAAGRSIPHAVFWNGQIVGQSCYLNIRPREAGVEIGSTWYARAAQGGIVNPSAKLLLIGNAFDQGAERVELKTDALNAHSRAAMLKMGAQFEGIHRKHMRRADGTLRDTAWFSVIRDEWPLVRQGLETRLITLATPPRQPANDETLVSEGAIFERGRQLFLARMTAISSDTGMRFEIKNIQVSHSPSRPLIVRAELEWTTNGDPARSTEMFWKEIDGTEGSSGEVLG